MSDSKVEIYVRSSPLGEQVGIHWRNISKEGQPKEEPSVLKEQVITRDDGKKVTINSQINDTKASLIFARYISEEKNKVLLELTGLDASEDRSKSMGRRISEIVLWVGDATPEVEFKLRKLAACALLSFWEKESDFLKKIRSSIEFDGLDSFKANAQKIDQLYTDAGTNLDRLLSKVSSGDINTSDSDWLTPKKIDIENQLNDLVNQIIQTPLPETEQPVVVVAEFKKEGDRQHIVYKGNVWKAPQKKTPLPVPSLQPVPPTERPIAPRTPASPSRLPMLRLILGFFLMTVIVIALWIIIFQSNMLTTTPTPAPTQTQTPNLRPNPNPSPSQILKEKTITP
ncbi:MAG: hypothetical protein V7L02_29190 [Nostoc sp.]|uniref:hypothetical protein n=1 Tax=Nostoc sp. TaxID=1180 RepID=UPI002FF957B1